MTKGSITLNGKQLEKLSNKQLSEIRKKDIGFIFQDYNILHTLTVKENIMLPLSVQKVDKEEMNRRYHRIAEALNISDISDKYPSELSGDNVNAHLLQERLLMFHPLSSLMSRRAL